MDKCGQACPYNTLDGCKVKEYRAICPLTNMATPITEYKMTNADRIRSMTDEELIELFGKNGLCDYVQEHSRNHCEKHGSCNGCLLEWLKKTAE